DIWQFRIRTLRRMIRGWASNKVAALNKQKNDLATEYNFLDNEAEQGRLPQLGLDRLKVVANELDKIWSLEEIKARQRSRDMNILEGDRNTAYFQALANRRARKKTVDCLMGPNGLVHDQFGMINIAVDFYKNLFAKDSREDFTLQSDFWDTDGLVTEAENSLLTAPFSEE